MASLKTDRKGCFDGFGTYPPAPLFAPLIVGYACACKEDTRRARGVGPNNFKMPSQRKMPRSDDPLKFFKGFRPCVRVGRAIHFDGGGGADDVAEFSEGGDLPFAHGLHQQIAHGRGFGRA